MYSVLHTIHYISYQYFTSNRCYTQTVVCHINRAGGKVMNPVASSYLARTPVVRMHACAVHPDRTDDTAHETDPMLTQ